MLRQDFLNGNAWFTNEHTWSVKIFRENAIAICNLPWLVIVPAMRWSCACSARNLNLGEARTLSRIQKNTHVCSILNFSARKIILRGRLAGGEWWRLNLRYNSATARIWEFCDAGGVELSLIATKSCIKARKEEQLFLANIMNGEEAWEFKLFLSSPTRTYDVYLHLSFFYPSSVQLACHLVASQTSKENFFLLDLPWFFFEYCSQFSHKTLFLQKFEHVAMTDDNIETANKGLSAFPSQKLGKRIAGSFGLIKLWHFFFKHFQS